MSSLRLVEVCQDDVSFGSCGVESIDSLVKSAYANCVFKKALAYNIIVDGKVVGGYMETICTIDDEEYQIGDSSYAAIKIDYLAIEKKYQRNTIGSAVLSILIRQAKKVSSYLPIRFLYLEALPSRVEWYERIGFKACGGANAENQFVVPMRMDFIDRDKVDQYEEQYC